MGLPELTLLILLLVAGLAVAIVVLLVRGWNGSVGSSSVVGLREDETELRRHELDVRTVELDTRYEVWSAAMDVCLARIERASGFGSHDTSALAPWVPRAVESFVQSLPRVVQSKILIPENTWIVTFPGQAITDMAQGSSRFMRSGGEALAVVVDQSGQTQNLARIVGRAGASTTGASGAVMGVGPQLGVAAVAAVAAYAHQRWLERTLEGIAGAIAALADRARDDDHGELRACLEHVKRAEAVLGDHEVLPRLYETKLAVASHRAETIYYSRRRLINRVVAEIDRSQSEYEARKGESRAWVPGLTDAFGKPEQFFEEVLVYLNATVVRSRVVVGSAAVLACRGHGMESLALLQETAGELNDDYFDLLRRINALVRHAPDKKSRIAPGPLLAGTQQLYELLEDQITPLIPPRSFSGSDVSVPLVIGSREQPELPRTRSSRMA